jgi:anti-anti-sigma regulatory factor
MLRITVHDKPQTLTFQLEGKLSAPSLRELEDCWKSTLAQPHKPNLCIDLADVTFIDDAGKACLAAMQRQGAEFVAADCATNALVAEISENTVPDR